MLESKMISRRFFPLVQNVKRTYFQGGSSKEVKVEEHERFIPKVNTKYIYNLIYELINL